MAHRCSRGSGARTGLGWGPQPGCGQNTPAGRTWRCERRRTAPPGAPLPLGQQPALPVPLRPPPPALPPRRWPSARPARYLRTPFLEAAPFQAVRKAMDAAGLGGRGRPLVAALAAAAAALAAAPGRGGRGGPEAPPQPGPARRLPAWPGSRCPLPRQPPGPRARPLPPEPSGPIVSHRGKLRLSWPLKGEGGWRGGARTTPGLSTPSLELVQMDGGVANAFPCCPSAEPASLGGTCVGSEAWDSC